MEDETIYEEKERRGYQKTGDGEDRGKYCGLGVMIAIGFILLVFFCNIGERLLEIIV